MSIEPVDEKIRAALEQLGRASVTPSQSFSEHVLNQVSSLAVKEAKHMRLRKALLIVIFVLVGAVCLWVLLASGSSYQGYGDGEALATAVNDVMTSIEGTFGALAMLAAGTLAILSLPLRRYKSSAALCTIAIGCFMLRSMTSTSFNDAGVQDTGGEESNVLQHPYKPKVDREMTTAGKRRPVFQEGAQVSGSFEHQLEERVLPSLPAAREKYGSANENKRELVSKEPLSTFSADVDTGSYSNMRRFVRQGQLPPPDSVRIEEYLNYFSFPCNGGNGRIFSSCYEIAPSPYESGRHLLKLTVAAKQTPLPDNVGWNIVMLVDVSGSMNEPMKLPLVKEGLKLLAAKMRPIDRIAIVTYAGSSAVALPSTLGSNKSAIVQAIDTLSADGSTNGAGGIEVAYRIASENFIPGSVNRVVLATDGDFNVGVTSTADLIRIIEEKRTKGITLTTLGFGEGNIREDVMEQLADKGNGNYFYIDSYQQVRRVLEEQFTANMQVVAKDVKLQVEFNPTHVSSYRLIGFDNRHLNAEDFTDDKKDAGEVGSGHTVTALYEITLTGSPNAGDSGSALRYRSHQPTPVPTDSEYDSELGVLRIRYQSPEGGKFELIEVPLQQSAIKDSVAAASDDYRFAVAVAGLGEFLRKGSYSSSIQLPTVLELARGAIAKDPDGSRQEFVMLAGDVERLSR